MIFRTPVEMPSQQLQLTPQSHTFFIGSCFADHIGQLMAECLPSKQVTVNPHGPLYNPVSIRQVLATYLPSGIAQPFDESGFLKLPKASGVIGTILQNLQPPHKRLWHKCYATIGLTCKSALLRHKPSLLLSALTMYTVSHRVDVLDTA